MGNHFYNIIVFLILTLVIICLFVEQSHHFPMCEEFLEKCDTELKKVNLFYSGNLESSRIVFGLMFLCQ